TPVVARGLRQPDDLGTVPLIVVPRLPDEWSCWLAAAGVRSLMRTAGELRFESNAMAMQAALDGVGVAIAQLCFVSDALATGRLIAPFPIIARTNENWLLQYRPIVAKDPALVAFRTWLHQEAKRQSEVETVLKRPE